MLDLPLASMSTLIALQVFTDSNRTRENLPRGFSNRTVARCC